MAHTCTIAVLVWHVLCHGVLCATAQVSAHSAHERTWTNVAASQSTVKRYVEETAIGLEKARNGKGKGRCFKQPHAA